MKRAYLILLISIVSQLHGLCQDKIITTLGDTLKGRVVSVGLMEVKYKKQGNMNGPTIILPKQKLARIDYQNGTFEVYDSETTSYEILNYNKGQVAALKNYRGYKTAGTTTLIVSLISPAAGLVPAIVCSSVKPREENLNFKKIEIETDPNYNQGYKRRARSIKSGKIWKNWGIALGINLAATILIVSQ